MPRFNMVLEELLSDTRSSEAAFRVKIENLGSATLELIRISPRIPEGVTLLEVKDSSSEAARSKHKKLCEEMTELLDEHIFESSKQLREARAQLEREYLTEIAKDMSAIFRVYLNMFTGKFQRRFIERREQLAAQKFILAGKDDADIALNTWFSPPSASSAVSEIFKAKYDQLVALECVVGFGPGSSALATIEPDSFFATTYVLRFPRTPLNSAKFSFSVEAALSELASSKEMLASTTTTIEISPRPYILSLVTVFFALLGVAVKFSIDQRALTSSISGFFSQLARTAFTGQGISAMVLGVVLFNIYENVDFGEKVKLKVGWRSAMLIGVISGLFSERVIAALKTLVGA